MDILQQVQNQESANEQNVERNWYKCFTKHWGQFMPYFILWLYIF